MGAYEDGAQPCDNFRPGADTARHECPGCKGLRMFCTSCSRDHHEDGWDKCQAGKAPPASEGVNDEVQKV